MILRKNIDSTQNEHIVKDLWYNKDSVDLVRKSGRCLGTVSLLFLTKIEESAVFRCKTLCAELLQQRDNAND